MSSGRASRSFSKVSPGVRDAQLCRAHAKDAHGCPGAAKGFVGLAADSALREHLLDSAIYMRPVTMGLLLLLVLRFWPRGLIPEESGADRR